MKMNIDMIWTHGGDERSAGENCHSCARDDTGSSQSGPVAHILSALKPFEGQNSPESVERL